MVSATVKIGKFEEEFNLENIKDPFSARDYLIAYLDYYFKKTYLGDAKCIPFNGGETFIFEVYSNQKLFGEIRVRIEHNEA